MPPVSALPHEVAERLGPFYVYALVDPRTDRIFYVGKGTGQRLLAHGQEADLTVDENATSAKVEEIRSIRSAGYEPRLDIVRHGITDEATALAIEAALIDTVPGLTNAVSGHGATLGRAPIEEYAVEYGARPVPPDAPPAVLIRLSEWKDQPEEVEPGVFRLGNGYRLDMSGKEIVDSTRAWWTISPKSVQRRGVEHAVTVHRGVTRAVMRIGDWIQRDDGKWAFSATLLDGGPVFEAWVGPLGRRVDFAASSQNPITYWPRL